MIRRLLGLTAIVLIGAGCDRPVIGQASAEVWGPDRVAGLSITGGPSGLRKDAPSTRVGVSGTDQGRTDRLAAAAVEDVQEYWTTQFPTLSGREYQPVSALYSYDSATGSGQLCGASTKGLVNAFHCGRPGTDLIAWDRGALLPTLTKMFGDMSVVAVLAHEIGHAVQARLTVSGSSIVREQQADCYAGSYFRWLAAGGSRRFVLSTGPGLNQVMATMFFIRDSPGSTADSPNAHGNAFDRVSAFQAGFGEGPTRCARMDEAEVNRRVTQESVGSGAETGELRLSDPDALTQLRETVNAVFGAAEPNVQTSVSCGRGATTYCVDQNTVQLDLPQLDRIGGGLGDFAAFAEVVSRYALARQRATGQPVKGLAAAQRSACMTGAWAAAIGPGDGQALRLSPGDLDEAVAEMLDQNSLIAADITGAAVPSGFARVDAFRTGFSSGLDICAKMGG